MPERIKQERLPADLTSVTLAANTPTVGTGAWSIISGAGGSFGDASSPTSIFTGTAGITYTLRWTITNTPCTPSTDDVVITFNENPTTANAGPDQTGAATCGLTSVTLAANTATVGTGTWSIISGAGGSFGNASSPTSTFNGTAGTTYTLRWTISNIPCTASTDDVVITFNQAPTTSSAGPDQTGAATCGLTSVTLAANTPTVGTGAWSIISGAGGSFGNASSPTSTFTGTAGVTYSLRWTITLAASICPVSTDDVVVTFNKNPSPANAGSDQAGVGTCGLTTVTLNANPGPVITGIGTWSFVSGTGGSFVNPLLKNTSFSGTAGTAYTLRWTITSGPCTPSTDDVNIIFNIAPAANAGADQDVCATTATLAGNVPAAGTGTWTLISGAGTITTPSSATSGITGLGLGANTFRWTIANAPCATSFDEVVITRSAAPTTAAAGPDQAACGTSTTLAGNTAATGTGSWSIISGAGGSIGTASSPTSTFTGVTGTTYTLRWTISNGGCTPSTDDVNITFNAAPTTAAAGPDQTGAATCGLTSVTLAANTPIVGTGAWSIISGAGGSIATASNPTSTFTGTAGTTYTLRWTISNAPCTSTDDVLITFNRNPTTATAGSPATICSNASTTLNGNAPTIGTGVWSVTSGPSISSAQFANTTVRNTTFTPAGGAGSYVLTWTISNNPCTASSANVTITVNPAPAVAAISGASGVCIGSAITLTDATPAGTWTSSNTGIATVNSASGLVTGVGSGTVTITYSVTSGGCTGTATKTVTVSSVPNPQVTFTQGQHDVDFSITACGTIDPGNQNDLDIYTGDPGGSSTYQWQVSNNAGGPWTNGLGPTSTATQFVLDPFYVDYLTVAGNYYFRLIITNNGCSGISDVIHLSVTGVSNLTPGSIAANQSFCNSGDPANLTSVSLPTGATGSYSYQWQSSTDNVNFTSTGVTTTTYNPPVISQTTYYRRVVVSGGCTANSNTITVSINAAAPASPGAITGNTPVCVSSAQTYSVAAVAGAASYTWTLPSGWTGSSTSNSINATPGATSGNVSVTATNGCGTSAASVLAVTVNALPTAANAGADQNNCNNGNFTLAGNNAVIGTGAWSLVSGTASITTPSSATSVVTGVPAGTTATLRWTISNGACTASTDDVVLNNKANPTTANAGLDQTGVATCSLTSVTLAANTAAVGTGAWTLVSGAGGGFGNAASPTSTFNGTAGTTYTLRWTISNAPCVASTDDLVVTFNRNPTAANAGPDQTSVATCGLTTVTLAANTPTVGTGVWSIISGAGGNVTTPSSPTSTFTGVAGTTYTLRWTISNAPCTASTDDVVITFNVLPTASNAGADQTGAATCGLTSVTLAANTPVTGTVAWSFVSGAGGSFVAASNPTTTFNGTAGTAYTLRWTITNGVCISTDDVLVTFNRNPTVADAGTDKSNCNSGSFAMTANTPAIGAGTWTLVSGTATITTPGSATSGITGVPSGTSATLRWTITNAPCAASFDDVVLTNVAASTVPNAGADQTQCNNGNFTLAGNTIVNGTGSWTVVSGTASITTASSPVSGVTGVPAGASATLRWTNTNAPCAVLTDDVVLTNNASPTTTGITICQGGSGSLTSSYSCPLGGTATAGPRNAGRGVDSAGVGSGIWSTPGNITTVNTPYATQNLAANGTTRYLKASNYGFTIPAGSTINGITVSIRRQGTSTLITDNVVKLLNATGAIVGTNFAGGTGTAWTSGSFSVSTYGGIANAWAAGLTAGDINDPDFGVVFSAISSSGSPRTLDVDYIQVTITYTAPGALNWFTLSSGGSSVGTGASFNPVPSVLPNTNTPGTTTMYAECSTLPGCRTATTFIINPTASLNTVSAAAICEGSSATVNLTGLVANSTANISYTIGVTSYNTTVTADAGGNTSFNTIGLNNATHNGQTLEITGINITSFTPNCSKLFTGKTVTLVVRSTGTWLGVNTDWNDPLNWCGGVPTTTTDILVPGSLVNYPLLNTGTGSVKSINIQNTASVIVSAAKLRVSGTITNAGTFNMTAGTLELNGSGTPQAISGSAFVSRILDGLIISNPSGVNVSNVLNDTLNITDSLAFGNVNNTVLNTGNNITLVSRAAKTARAADITNNGVNSGNSFTGKVMIERYIPEQRSWRLLTVPIQTTGAPTFNASWQEGVVNPDYVYANNLDPHPGFGMHISGISPALGFDPTPQNNASIKYYSPVTGLWTGIPNTTSTKVSDSAGYMVFVRGNRSTQLILNTAAATSNTVLRAAGLLKINNQTTTVPAGAGAYTVAANPYASAIDLRKITTTGAVSASNFVVWDPSLTGINSVGAYQYFTRSGGPGTDYTVFPGGGSYGAAFSINNTIQSSQAFMVQNAGTGTVSINENAKVAGSSSTVFRPSSDPVLGSSLGYLSTLLLYETNDSDGSKQLVDGALSLYRSDYSNAVDLEDARKLLNFSSENIGIDDNGNWLQIEKRSQLKEMDTIYYRIKSMRVRDYQFKISAGNFNQPGITAFLEDKYLHTSTAIDMDGTTLYPFKVTADSGAWDPSRFKIVFRNLIALPVSFSSVKAYRNSNYINVEWNVEHESAILDYEVEKSADGIHFIPAHTETGVQNSDRNAAYRWVDKDPIRGMNFYRIRSRGQDASEKLSPVVKVAFEKQETYITLYPNPVTNGNLNLYFINEPAGEYTVRLLNNAGQLMAVKKIRHNAASTAEPFNTERELLHGNYLLEILRPDGTKQTINVMY